MGEGLAFLLMMRIKVKCCMTYPKFQGMSDDANILAATFR